MARRVALSAAIAGVILVTAGCGTEPAAVALKNARSESSVAKALDRLFGEQGGEALTQAFCTGVSSYVNKNEPPSGGDWGNYILSQAGLPTSQFQEKADELGTALRLAQQNGGATANAYTRACLAR